MGDSIGNTFLFVKGILATKYRVWYRCLSSSVNSVYYSLKFCIFIGFYFKVGTLQLAISVRHYGIPFYISRIRRP